MAEKSTLEQLLEQGPPAAPTQTTDRSPRPIGVPETTRDPVTGEDVPFTVTGRALPTRGDYESGHDFVEVQRPPLYWTGDEWRPGAWDPRKIADLQDRMAAAGLFGPDDSYQRGVWDKSSRDAYEELLGRANAMGMPWEQAIQVAKATFESQPLQVKLTDPEDLRRVFRSAAFEVSATQFTPGQIDAMVAAYHEKERAAQEAAARGETTVTAPPDPTTFAEQQAEEVNPEGVKERRMQNAETAWLAAIQEGGATGG